MGRPSKYPQELRERAVRMVTELTPEYPTEFAAIRAVATKLGVGSEEAVRKWVRRAQAEGDPRPGPTTAERNEIRT
jgi:transposase